MYFGKEIDFAIYPEFESNIYINVYLMITNLVLHNLHTIDNI